jgi:uncharacterized protein (TIGR03435 family)
MRLRTLGRTGTLALVLVFLMAGVPGVGLDRAVVDNTGVAGKFPVHLKFAPDVVATGPHPFTAVRKQLGLKFDSPKGPVEVLAVDHVEKPSEN